MIYDGSLLSKSKQLARNINSLNKLRDYILEHKLDSVLNQACEYALKYKLLAVTDLLYVNRTGFVGDFLFKLGLLT